MAKSKMYLYSKRLNKHFIIDKNEAESIRWFFDNPGRYPNPDDCFWASFGQILRREMNDIKIYPATKAAIVLYAEV